MVTPRLCWLTLYAPELARTARPGHYLLVHCAPPGSADPLLPRALFIAATEEKLGQVVLLFEPTDRGLHWLATTHAQTSVDALGPFGQPFQLQRRTGTLLLIGHGPGLAALIFLARVASGRQMAVSLSAGGSHAEQLPPAFLLPGDIEYESSTQLTLDTTRLNTGLRWADQVCAALPTSELPLLAESIRKARLRWDRGYASVLVEATLVCGVGACGACVVTARRGQRWLCSAGPVVDLRDW
jgi:hypothetical protein